VEADIVRKVRIRLGAGMRVEFVSVAEIPVEASGKYRTVVNNVGISPNPEAGPGGPEGQR